MTNKAESLAGLDMELEQEEATEESKVVSYEEAKIKRKPFHFWTVAGVDYKLKLTTSMIVKLENKYGTNVMNLIMTDGTPPLSVMLTVAQAALAPWEHKTDIAKVYALYDKWLEEGGSQTEFLTKVILPTMAVSGFFTGSQRETVEKAVEEAEMLG